MHTYSGYERQRARGEWREGEREGVGEGDVVNRGGEGERHKKKEGKGRNGAEGGRAREEEMRETTREETERRGEGLREGGTGG